MDGEQGITSQQPLREIPAVPEDREHEFGKTLERTRQTMNTLSKFAVEHGTSVSDFIHLQDVFTEDSHVLLPPLKAMRAELVKIKGDIDTARRTRALHSPKTGQVFVPEEVAGSLHDILHESTHRAGWLHDRQLGLTTDEALLTRQLAERYGIAITPDGKVDPENSEYIKKYALMKHGEMN